MMWTYIYIYFQFIIIINIMLNSWILLSYRIKWILFHSVHLPNTSYSTLHTPHMLCTFYVFFMHYTQQKINKCEIEMKIGYILYLVVQQNLKSIKLCVCVYREKLKSCNLEENVMLRLIILWIFSSNLSLDFLPLAPCIVFLTLFL